MNTNTLNRKALSTSRLMEFFTEKELNMQIGYAREVWPLALLKELIDNALDATESKGNEPIITITVKDDFVSVQDNGTGLPETVIEQSLDYAVRISDKSAYVSPSRGQLGNALKCVWAAPFVIDREKGVVEIETSGKKHTITVLLNRIAQKPEITHTVESGAFVEKGTFIKMYWNDVARYLNPLQRDNLPYLYKASELISCYAAFNPHVTFRLNDDCIEASGDFDKWQSNKPTSPHWYSQEKLKTLIAGYIAAGEKTTVRAFVSEFKGLSTSAKQKQVTDLADLTGQILGQLVTNNDIDTDKTTALLNAMQYYSQKVKPKTLGIIGRDHFIHHLMQIERPNTEPKYKMIQGSVDGLPFVIEIGFNFSLDQNLQRKLITGINWTPLLQNPFHVLDYQLNQCRVEAFDPCVVIFHLACPKIDFTDRAKSRASLPLEIEEAIFTAVESVTTEWVKLKRRADKDGRMQAKALQDAENNRKKAFITVKDASYQTMESAYLKASNDGTLPANARQIMYAARGEIIKLTGKSKPWAKDSTFTQNHLPDFMESNPELTENWDVVFDARGHFQEPHTGNGLGIGTLEVRQYMHSWTDKVEINIDTPQITAEISTHGAVNRFKTALFIEKEGFTQIMSAVNLAERYDIAIMSTKGMSTTASRTLIENLSEKGVRILVVRDFDLAGFTIAHTLCHDTRRYTFKTKPNVIDLGLTLEDAQDMNLESEEVTYSNKIDPRAGLKKRGATDKEADFLVSGGYEKNWQGERIELNAMTSNVFIEWLERKFEEQGVEKFIPADDVIKQAYRRATKAAKVQQIIDDALEDIEDDEIEVPDDLSETLANKLKDSVLPWDKVITELFNQAA